MLTRGLGQDTGSLCKTGAGQGPSPRALSREAELLSRLLLIYTLRARVLSSYPEAFESLL